MRAFVNTTKVCDPKQFSLKKFRSVQGHAHCYIMICSSALGIFEEVKQIRLTQAGMDSSPVIQTMLRIGNVQLARGDAHMALECFNEIVGIGYSSDAINGIEVANAFYGKGCAQFILFELSDAMKSLKESLNWKLAALGEDDPGLACIFYQSKSRQWTCILV